MVNGLDNPLTYLEADMNTVTVLNKVIETAQEMRAERKKNEMKALASYIREEVGKLLR